ncbi:MAG TPA: outer membrane protein assembly factor BamE [Methylophilaceae bacterium]|nr:outer membrane protein assembly factor BamE [Methylophilaceae bacterium]
MRHLITILALLCASCNASLPSIKPYKMDIQQGNVVTSKMMLQLKPGMSKSQVRFVMGTPLIQDSFHPDRWDYFYEMRKGGKLIEQRRVTMDFENDALVRIRGDVIPAGTGQSVAEPQPVTPHKAKSKKPEKKKSLLDRLQFWKDEEEATQPQAAPGDLVAPAAVPAPAESIARPAETPAVEQQPAAEAPPAPAKPEESASPTLESAPAESAPAESTPAPSEQANPVGKPVVKPSLMPTKPAPVPEMAPIESPPPAEAAPAAPAKQSSPPPAPEPEPAAPAPASEAATPPAAKTEAAPKPAAKPSAEEEPSQDLPPEDDPGYFERMLEKIGF